MILDSDKHVYHNTNTCYKSYTHSGKLQSIEKKMDKESRACETEDEASVSSVKFRRTLRKSVRPCAPPSSDKDPRTLPCVICGYMEHKKCRDKYRICEYDSANKRIDAAKHNQDAVFTRIADRLKDDVDSSVKSVISADLFCHHICRQNYMRKYEREHVLKADVLKKPAITNIKHELFTRAVPYIDTILAKGECCSMSDIVQFALSLLEEGEVLQSTFQACDMKKLILDHYGESVTIAPNTKMNESDIFFSSDINATDLAIKLKNQDIMRGAGTKLREALIDVDFGLQDSFCDSTDLKASWEKTMMPAPVLTFLAALFKVPKHKLFQSRASDLEDLLPPLQDNENQLVEELLPQQQQPTDGEPPQMEQPQQEQEETWVRDHKSTQLHCLFQMLVYTVE